MRQSKSHADMPRPVGPPTPIQIRIRVPSSSHPCKVQRALTVRRLAMPVHASAPLVYRG